jgi:mRNA interferase MazF
MRQGDVYWWDFGAAVGPAPAHRHPCVIVQSDLFNKSRIKTTVVCLITSNMSLADVPGNVPLAKGEGNVTKPSVVNVSQTATVDKSELVERIGRLPAAKAAAILSGLHLLIDGP